MASEDHSDTIAETNRPVPAPVALDPIPLPNNSLLPLNLCLDRTNYSYWSVLALAATHTYNLDGYVLGTTTQPLPTVPVTNQPNPAYIQWLHFDQFLMHWLLNSISQMLLGHVLRCRSSSKIWSTLRRFFTTSSKAKILQVKGLLQSTKKGSLSVDDYIMRMRQYADVLSEADEPISDDSLCMYILAGLGPEFESTVTLLINPTEPLNLTDLHFSLHTHELRLQQSSTPSLDQPQANFDGTSSRGNGRSSGRSNHGANRGGEPIQEAVLRVETANLSVNFVDEMVILCISASTDLMSIILAPSLNKIKAHPTSLNPHSRISLSHLILMTHLHRGSWIVELLTIWLMTLSS